MATDIEESDMEEHEHPGPAKRRRTNYTKTLDKRPEESVGSNKTAITEKEAEGEADQDLDEVEKLAREKLRLWQKCQLDTGFLDNMVNDILDRFFFKDLTPFFVGGDNEMESRAVAMAIVSRGLAHSASRADLVSSDICWSINESSDSSSASDDSLSHESSAIIEPPSLVPTSTVSTGVRSWNEDKMDDSNRSLSRETMPSCSTIIDPPSSTSTSAVPGVARCWNEDKMDETDREQDFLERAVAEAIKKKGLSALSVDYG
ncbi:uncharacterized protein [Venturia canescens]|uniref:uncharacterized protein n=1 Tax=Venturia canescens TaxID=32260 RepID=UPI001C9D57B0|nr:uncharacterized protein LOC122408156 [Venturia canescens]